MSPRTSWCDSGAPPGASTAPAPVTRSIASATGSSTLIHLQGTCSRLERQGTALDRGRHRQASVTQETRGPPQLGEQHVPTEL